jgi:putative SOS response-associated peptidase YedK
MRQDLEFTSGKFNVTPNRTVRSRSYLLCAYLSRRQKQEIAGRARAKKVFEEPYLPNFNVAPTTFQPIARQVRDTDERELVLARWGFVPFFAKGLANFNGFLTFNARAETIATAATWREPFK